MRLILIGIAILVGGVIGWFAGAWLGYVLLWLIGMVVGGPALEAIYSIVLISATLGAVGGGFAAGKLARRLP